MLNGFCRKGYNLSLQNYNPNIEAYIKKRIEDFLANNDKVIFMCDSHSDSDFEIEHLYPRHCIKGTDEAKIIDSLSDYTDYKENVKVLTKHTLSIMYQTELESKLQELNPDEIELVGVCTDICDLFAVYELRIRGYTVKVSRQGMLPSNFNPDKQEEFLDYFKTMLNAEVY
jgi:nicotinamidase-related amidase